MAYYEGTFGETTGRIEVIESGGVYEAVPHVVEGGVPTPVQRLRGGQTSVRSNSESGAVEAAALVLESHYGPRRGPLQRVGES
jgi:hypothetical protein